MNLDQIFVIAKQQVLAWLTEAGASVGVVQVISSLINIAAVLAVFLNTLCSDLGDRTESPRAHPEPLWSE